ncbi:MAG: hypothetical protein ABR535_01100 [Pyrinomonadaceae bacterium]
MSDNKLQKRAASPTKEKGQYVLVFGVIASMLLVAGFPVFVIFFFAIFAFLLFKMFASGSRSETREIFEFYLSANELLRDDERRWYGFEIRDVIERGESVLRRMSPAPPLLYFALGALYNKAGDHVSSTKFLAEIIDGEKGNESTVIHATHDLRNYVRVLRKIERDPADAPLTSAAIRALERARKIRGKALLEESRTKAAEIAVAESEERAREQKEVKSLPISDQQKSTNGQPRRSVTEQPKYAEQRAVKRKTDDPYADRKPISEVLHDIYDRNVQ